MGNTYCNIMILPTVSTNYPLKTDKMLKWSFFPVHGSGCRHRLPSQFGFLTGWVDAWCLLLAKCQVSAAEMRPLWQLDSADKVQVEVATRTCSATRGTR